MFPEIALSIRRTAKGDYEASIWSCKRAYGEGPKAGSIFECLHQETFEAKLLPDFMWQLAKRIMPK